jgi:hypothetical protein
VSPVTWSLNQLCSLACCAAFLCKHLRTDRLLPSNSTWSISFLPIGRESDQSATLGIGALLQYY